MLLHVSAHLHIFVQMYAIISFCRYCRKLPTGNFSETVYTYNRLLKTFSLAKSLRGFGASSLNLITKIKSDRGCQAVSMLLHVSAHLHIFVQMYAIISFCRYCRKLSKMCLTIKVLALCGVQNPPPFEKGG